MTNPESSTTKSSLSYIPARPCAVMGLPLGLIAKKSFVVFAGKNVLFWVLSAKAFVRESSCCESEDNFLKCICRASHNSVNKDVSFDVFEQIESEFTSG